MVLVTDWYEEKRMDSWSNKNVRNYKFIILIKEWCSGIWLRDSIGERKLPSRGHCDCGRSGNMLPKGSFQ